MASAPTRIGPWERYASTPETESGPWSQYASEAPAEATSPPSPARTSANPMRARRQRNLERGLTPEQAQARREAVTGIIDAAPGFRQLEQGVGEMMTPGQRKEGLHNVIVGGGKMAAPVFLPPAIVAAPIPTAYAIGTGMVGATAGEGAARLAGAEPDTAALFGDAVGILAGGAAGSPGPIGAQTRGAVRGALESLPLVGRLLKGAREGARAGLEREGFAAPAAAEAPKPAPSTGPKAAPAAEPDAKLMDEIAAKSLGAKDFASVPDNLKPLVRTLAAKASSQPPAQAATEPQIPRPSPKKAPVESTTSTAPEPSPTAVSQEPVATMPKPRTVRELLDQELAAKSTPPPPEAPPRAVDDIPRVVAKDLLDKGLTVDEVLKLTPEQRTDALGDDAGRFADIVREMRSQALRSTMDAARSSKDQAVARFLRAKGITPEQVAAMDEGVLLTHVKDAGFRSRGGSLSRSPAQLRHDIVEAMRAAPESPVVPAAPTVVPEGIKRAPGSPGAEPRISPPESPRAPASPVAAASSPVGIEAVVRTPNGTKARVRYRISEADDIKTSFDADYNSEIGHQPRDTSRIGSEQRIAQRMGDMDPEAMGNSRMAGDGAPITRQNHAVTRNHGTEALKRLYRSDSPLARQYREWVQEQAGLAGMTPEQVAGMKKPVLHRELAEEWDHAAVKQFADEANMSSVARMSEAELAQQMGEKMSGSTMDAFRPTEDGVPNPEFIRGLIRDFPAEEQALFFDRYGEVSQAGARLTRNAVFAKAYNNVSAIERMAEATDSQVRNITTAMLKAAPPFAKLNESISRGDSHPLSISDELGKAVEVIDRLRTEKRTVSDWLKQGDLLGRDPVVHTLVNILAQESRRPNMIRDTLNNFVEAVVRLGSPKQQGIFGDVELPRKLELLEDAYARAQSDAAAKAAAKGQPSLLGPDSGGAPTGP